MKLRSISLVAIMLLFGFGSYAQTISISASPGDTVCSGTPVTFTASVTPTGSYGYIWKVNGAPVSSTTSTYTSTAPATGDVVFCLLTNAAGDTILALSDTLIMYVNSLPVISPIMGVDSVCIGDTVHLSDAAGGGVWASSNTAAATISAIGTVTGIALPAGGGGGFGGPSLRIYYILTNGCGSDSTNVRFYVREAASPIASPGTLCIDSTAGLRDTVRGGNWISGDTSIAAFVGFPGSGRIQGVAAGSVTITYDLTNACGTYAETATITIVNCDTSTTTGVKQVVSLANSCTVYPNPSKGAFSISVRSVKYAQASCTIVNMVGEKVKDFIINTNTENAINAGIPAGVYFLTVTAGDEKYTSKLLIAQ